MTGVAGLTGHFMNKGNALGFGRENEVVFGNLLQKRAGALDGELLIAEKNEGGDL